MLSYEEFIKKFTENTKLDEQITKTFYANYLVGFIDGLKHSRVILSDEHLFYIKKSSKIISKIVEERK